MVVSEVIRALQWVESPDMQRALLWVLRGYAFSSDVDVFDRVRVEFLRQLALPQEFNCATELRLWIGSPLGSSYDLLSTSHTEERTWRIYVGGDKLKKIASELLVRWRHATESERLELATALGTAASVAVHLDQSNFVDLFEIVLKQGEGLGVLCLPIEGGLHPQIVADHPELFTALRQVVSQLLERPSMISTALQIVDKYDLGLVPQRTEREMDAVSLSVINEEFCDLITALNGVPEHQCCAQRDRALALYEQLVMRDVSGYSPLYVRAFGQRRIEELSRSRSAQVRAAAAYLLCCFIAKPAPSRLFAALLGDRSIEVSGAALDALYHRRSMAGALDESIIEVLVKQAHGEHARLAEAASAVLAHQDVGRVSGVMQRLGLV